MPTEDPTDGLSAAVDRLREELVETRRQLHREPELSFEERETAALCAERCEALGFEVRSGVGGTGVIADLRGAGDGPTLMVRADIDALPIPERGTDRVAVSQREGVMHACGHDGHIAVALGVASLLADRRALWPGRLRMCFQPAEEVAGGALPMIDDGADEGVDRVLGIHIWSPLRVGRVAVTPGPLFGSADQFSIVVTGRGGHGGMPHDAVDAIVAAGHVLLALQSIVSRETSPFAPAVVTIGTIEGGRAFNVIAEEVRMRGTVRAMEQAQRERVLGRIAEVATATASAHRCEARMEIGDGCPPVVSDGAVAEVVRMSAVATVGQEQVEVASPITVGDDVSCFLERHPGCYFLVGAGNPERGITAPHHHPEFDIDEGCLTVGVGTLTRASLAVLAGAA